MFWFCPEILFWQKADKLNMYRLNMENKLSILFEASLALSDQLKKLTRSPTA